MSRLKKTATCGNRWRQIETQQNNLALPIARRTPLRLQLVRRFAASAVLAELMESRLANGENISVQEHAYLTSTLCRVVQRIGIDRRSKDVTPLLKDILSDPSLAEELVNAQDEVDEMQEDSGVWP